VHCRYANLNACVVSPTETKKKKPSRHITYRRQPHFVRVLALLLCAKFFADGEPNWAVVHAQLYLFLECYNAYIQPKPPLYIGSKSHDYLKRWWNNFMHFGSVADAPRSGRPHKISLDGARRAAAIVKTGRWLVENRRGGVAFHRVHYTSIGEAVRLNVALQNFVQRHNINHHQLLHAMRMADPTLARRKIFFKHLFTAKELASRREFAMSCLRYWMFWPSQLGNFLEHIIFIDESSIAVNKFTRSDVYVWCDSSDVSFRDVCPRQLAKGPGIVVRFIVAVTSHPAFASKGGVVYVELTSGTTDIQRRTNKLRDGAQATGDQVYQVGVLPLVDSYVAITVSVITAVGHK
jgi:hypothetical protein